jgi:hypothetical protein
MYMPTNQKPRYALALSYWYLARMATFSVILSGYVIKIIRDSSVLLLDSNFLSTCSSMNIDIELLYVPHTL